MIERTLENEILLSLGQFPAVGIIGSRQVGKTTLAMMIAENVVKTSPEQLNKLYQKGKELQRKIEEKLGPNGVLICPPYNQAAPKHNAPWLNLFAAGYSATFNVLEFPATVVPIFWNDKGLPVGVQVLGSRFSDHVTLAVGRALEEAYGGWRPAKI